MQPPAGRPAPHGTRRVKATSTVCSMNPCGVPFIDSVSGSDIQPACSIVAPIQIPVSSE